MDNKYYIGKSPLWINNQHLIKYKKEDNYFFNIEDENVTKKVVKVIN
jgi:hypothetical protein